jgi:2-phosphosulfolactate phosphatase
MCSSGRELIEQGFAEDVAIAAELDSSTAVPVLRDGAFTALVE